jgi:uridine kinase
MTTTPPRQADFDEVVAEVSRLRRTRRRAVVAISGYAGSGKSTLARDLVEAVDRTTRLRGDDFLDPERSHLRSADWDGVDRARMRTEVLDPFRRDQTVRFHPYDWEARRLGPATALPPATVVVVDGIGIFHPDLQGCFDLTVWIDVELEDAVRRGLARDQAAGRDHDRLWSEVWTPNDRDFAEVFSPAAQADLHYVPAGLD